MGAARTGAAEQWIKLTTPHFEMYTSQGETRGVEALEVFEEARSFFLENSPSKTVPDVPVRIIAFRSEKEYRPYRVQEGAFAYYQRGRKRDYIVMQDISPQAYPAAIHEYTHLFVQHLGFRSLPVWFNEGVAEVYSSLESKRKNQLMVGRPLPERLRALSVLGWMDLRVLLNVDQQSVYYRQPEKMAQFYGESWALTHMLMLGKEYRNRFAEFETALAEGKSGEECFQDVYRKTLNEVQADLRAYFTANTVQVSVFDTHLNKKELEPNVTRPPQLETDLALAELLSTHPQSLTEARSRLIKLAADHPANPDVEESLAYLYWQEGNIEKAESHFAGAIEKGSKDPVMLYQYAGLMHTTNGQPAEVMKMLEQALALDPSLYDARFNLGLMAVTQNQCDLAISTLMPITNVKVDRAFAFYYAMAVCEARVGNAAEGKRLGELAQRYARDEEQHKRADRFLNRLDDKGDLPGPRQ